MNKWYNKERTRMMDLDAVNGYVWTLAKDIVNFNQQPELSDPSFVEGDKLEVILGGSVFVFRGEQAIELYNLLREDNKINKELLQG